MSPLSIEPGPAGVARWIVALAAAAVLLPASAPPLAGQTGPADAGRGPGQAAGDGPAWTVPLGMIPIPGGRYVPQYATDDDGVAVAPFALDRTPVTVDDFRAFVEARPRWRRSRVKPIFADSTYLASWTGDLDPGLRGPELRRPVTEVSWFAARAYCAWRGARLATTDEWEYAASAGETERNASDEPAFARRLLALYGARPAPDALPPVGETFRNAHGVWDLHGLVWEWTADFNNQVLTGAGRDDRGLDRQLFCAAGSVGATDMKDYAAFLRYAYRSSLSGDYGGRLLGFRCAADAHTR